MKALLLILFSCLFFCTSGTRVFAYDMEVQCHETKCAVSTHAPLFPPGINWIPEMQLEKSIILKNTVGSQKDIYFRIIPKSQIGQLDEYMLLSFRGENDSVLWNGTLAELMTSQTVPLITLPVKETYPVMITASMQPDTPNTLQGSSTSFDFGFGFNGQQTVNTQQPSSNASSSNNSNNGSENMSTTTSSENQSTLVNSVTAIVTGLTDFINATATDADVSKTVLPSVLGTITEQQMKQGIQCVSFPFWWIIPIVETLLLVATFRIFRPSVRIAIQGILVLFSAALIILAVCDDYMSLIALLPASVILFPFLLSGKSYQLSLRHG